jgi:hypothetical protein
MNFPTHYRITKRKENTRILCPRRNNNRILLPSTKPYPVTMEKAIANQTTSIASFIIHLNMSYQ